MKVKFRVLAAAVLTLCLALSATVWAEESGELTSLDPTELDYTQAEGSFVEVESALTNIPYRSYTFDYWVDATPTPIPYQPAQVISGKTLGTDLFNAPADLAVAENGDLYIADSGNNRIVVTGPDGGLKKVISSFRNNGKDESFNKPAGVSVGPNGEIHIADTENRRIVSLTPEGELVQTFGMDKDALTGADFQFQPLKVAVDGAHRYYVVARNVFQGLMSFNEDGTFFGYFGAIKTTDSMIDRFWKMVATQAQKEKMALFVPTEFTNIDIDEGNFVYATNLPNMNEGGNGVKEENTVRRLNPKGNDVLINYNTKQKIMGDQYYRTMGPYSGPSKLVDVKVRGKGMYSALDSTRGRIYTYDSEGNLLYEFGGMGTQLGMFKQPVAVEAYGNTLYILDQTRGEVVAFQPTRYGELITTAVGLRYDGAESEAVQYWQEVLKLNANYELAYSGIGKSLLAQNKNREAGEYLEKGMDKRYYSVAYKRYRNEVLEDNIYYIFAGIAIAVLAGTVLHIVRKRRKVSQKEGGGSV